MSLALTTRRRARIPYQLPTAAPYNVPVPAITPTYDGSGQTVHPSVLDFGATGWRGWRYWMGITPYPFENSSYENPSVLASRNGYHWQEPRGITNPIDLYPGGSEYNSDFDIEYDPDADRLVGIWRHFTSGAKRFWMSDSADGITWSTPVEVFTSTLLTRDLSPSLVRVSATQWRCYGLLSSGPGYVAASDPMSTSWSSQVVCSISGSMVGSAWHHEVNLGADGVYRMLLNRRDPWNLFACSSLDGVSWTANTTPILGSRSGQWDASIYRATFTDHEDGEHYRIWYSAFDGSSPRNWRTGYTQVPRTLWPF